MNDKTMTLEQVHQEKLDDFIARAGFTYGWKNLEPWAWRMAEQAVEELGAIKARDAKAVGVPDGWKRATEWIGDNYDDYSDVNALLRAMDEHAQRIEAALSQEPQS